MLVGKIVAGEFAKAEQAAVAGNGIEAHAAAELFKKFVVGVSHGVGEIHVLAATNFEHGVARDDTFLKSGECNGGLDGGARDGPVRVGEFLIDYGKNAAGVGIDSDHGTVVTAKSVNGGRADDGIVIGGNVADSWINSLFRANVTMTRTRIASRFCGGLGRSSGFGGKRASSRCGEEQGECDFSEPGVLGHVPLFPLQKSSN
jgi:hypothetical protein